MSRCLLTLLLLITVNACAPAQTKHPDNNIAWVKFGVMSMQIRVKYKITPDALERNWLDANDPQIDSSTVKLPASQWKQSRFIIDSLPSLLLTAGHTANWGCLHCHDQAAVIIELGFKNNRPPLYYAIDSDTIRLPAPIRKYVAEVMEQTNRLVAAGDKNK